MNRCGLVVTALEIAVEFWLLRAVNQVLRTGRNLASLVWCLNPVLESVFPAIGEKSMVSSSEPSACQRVQRLGDRGPEVIIAELYDSLLSFAQGIPQQDDLTAVLIRRSPVDYSPIPSQGPLDVSTESFMQGDSAE